LGFIDKADQFILSGLALNISIALGLRELNQAIISEVWHPKRITKWIERGFELEDL
jgi:hypothetical protein